MDERKKTKTQLIGELAVLRQQIEQMVCSGFLESLLYVQKDRDRRKDGSTCFVDVAGNVINDLDDSPARTIAVIQDITESKRTKEALSLSEEKFAKAFAGNPAAIVMTRLEDGLFLEVNDTWVTLTGYSREEVIGQSARELHIWPTVEAAVHFIRELQEKGFLRGWEQEFTKKSGEVYVVQLSAQVLNVRGEKVVLSTLVDITERKQAEEALRNLNDELEQRVIQRTRFYTLIAGINEAIVRYRDRQELLDEVCRIMVETGGFRLAWIGILDTTSREVMHEESCGETSYLNGIKIIAADTPEGRGPTGRAIAEGRHVINADFEADPNMLPWRDRARAHGIRSSSAFPLRSEGRVIGALTIYSEKPSYFTDEEISLLLSITDNISFALDAISGENKRLKAEEALKRLNEELEQRVAKRTVDLEEANKELEAFSYSVSHDLRAPLRHVSGFTELLLKKLKDHPDEKARNYANLISDSSSKMGVLIDNLLDFSRLGRSEIRKTKVSLNALVKGVVQEIREELKERKIRWEIDELPDVLGDESLLRLVMVNLVLNSVKFTSTLPQAEIMIGCKDEGDKFTFSIRDNGVGFDMKYADRLFGVFQRLHTQKEFEGTGIGLANVQRIIARHCGRVWAEGAVGQGATFYFTLPKIK